MQRALISALVIALAVLSVNAQEAVKPSQESRPADPRPAVTELNLNVNPDSQFYKLASGTRMENNGTNAWKLNTLGFREIRIVVSMGADSKKENRATGSSVVVTMHTSDGDHDVEIGRWTCRSLPARLVERPSCSTSSTAQRRFARLRRTSVATCGLLPTSSSSRTHG